MQKNTKKLQRRRNLKRNTDTDMNLITTLLDVFSGIVIGWYIPIWLSKVYIYFLSKEITKNSIPQKVDDNKMCKTRHDWIEAVTFAGSKTGKTRLCRLCGFIPELNLMASYEAIDRIEENNKIRQLEDNIYKDFINKEDEDIKKFFTKEIENGVSFDKLVQLHSAGITFMQRYGNYKLSRAPEIEKELTKDNA